MLGRTGKATAVVVILLNCCGLALAQAANNGVASNVTAQTIGSATWSLVPIATSASPNSQAAYVISPVVRSTNAATGSYFVIKNFGTVQTLSLSVTQVVTGSGTYTVNLHYCAGGVWNTSTGARSGTTTLIVTNTNASTNSGTATITLAPGASFQLRAQYVDNKTDTVTDTVSVSVSPSNLRTATNRSG